MTNQKTPLNLDQQNPVALSGDLTQPPTSIPTKPYFKDLSSSLQSFTDTSYNNSVDIYNNSPESAKTTNVTMTVHTVYAITILLLTYITYQLLRIIKPRFLVDEKKQIRMFRTFLFTHFVNSIIILLVVRYYPELTIKYLKLLKINN